MENIAKALNEFQAELVAVGKTANNPFFKSKYAPLDAVMKEAQPVLTKHGLAVVQLPSSLDGQPALTTTIFHTSGEKIESTVPLLLAKQDPQGLGSAITYMRRYAYAAALQIVIDDDDDGNSTMKPKTAYKAPVKPVEHKPDPLTIAKQKLMDTLLSNDKDTAIKQRAVIMQVLQKSTVDTEEEAYVVIDALDDGLIQ